MQALVLVKHPHDLMFECSTRPFLRWVQAQDCSPDMPKNVLGPVEAFPKKGNKPSLSREELSQGRRLPEAWGELV